MESSPAAAKELLEACEDLRARRTEVVQITEAALSDPAQQRQVKDLVASVRSTNDAILRGVMNAEQMSDRIADLNISVDNKADEIEQILFSPEPEGIENILASVSEQVGQQKLLSHTLLTHLPQDGQAHRRDAIHKALVGVDGTINRLRTAAAEGAVPGADRVARNRLKKALEEVTVKSEGLTAASQPSLVHRILANGAAIRTNCATIVDPTQEQEAFRLVKDGQALKRFDKQMQLCHQMANQCTDPQLKTVTRKLVEFGTKTADQARAIVPQATCAAHSAPVFDKLRQINDKLVIAAQRAESCSEEKDATTLAGAAQYMLNASEHLLVDASPKGELNALAKRIAEELKKMSDSAEERNKRGLITSAKTISQMTNDVVKIASTIPTDGAFKQFRNEMLSMAHAARNSSVQLKILAAVKTSSPDNDPTADTQLITCAKGLASSVMECINGAEVLELKNYNKQNNL